MTRNYILPNAAFVTDARNDIRRRLLQSLDHIIFDVLRPRFAPPIAQTQLTRWVADTSHFPNAAVFALHGALLRAAMNDDTSGVPDLFRIFKRESFWGPATPDQLQVSPLSGHAMDPEAVFLLKRAFADDVGLTASLNAPSQAAADTAARLIEDAVQGLKHAAPDWYDELLLLANQAMLAVADCETEVTFAGATVFDAFGAILINPSAFRNVPSMLMALIHESAHQLMFLYHLDDPIVLNDAAAVYTSPLRVQPRPMEGIFHALWVSARMVAASEAILNSLDRPHWAEELRDHQRQAYIAFCDCEQTVSQHAELSDLGLALFQSAQEAVHAI